MEGPAAFVADVALRVVSLRVGGPACEQAASAPPTPGIMRESVDARARNDRRLVVASWRSERDGVGRSVMVVDAEVVGCMRIEAEVAACGVPA